MLKLVTMRAAVTSVLFLGINLQAARTVSATMVPLGQYIYVSISNPSTVRQTVDVTFKATGNLSFGTNTGTTSGVNYSLGVACSDSRNCENASTAKTFDPGTNFTFGITVPGYQDGGGTPSTQGITVTITAHEPKAYLVAHGMYQYFLPSYDTSTAFISFAINAGRPF